MRKEILAIKKGNKAITLEDRGYDRQSNARHKKKEKKCIVEKKIYCKEIWERKFI